MIAEQELIQSQIKLNKARLLLEEAQAGRRKDADLKKFVVPDKVVFASKRKKESSSSASDEDYVDEDTDGESDSESEEVVEVIEKKKKTSPSKVFCTLAND
jgi:hypothetical protein